MPSPTPNVSSEPLKPVRLSVSLLPADENVTFKDSSYFIRFGANAALPSPAEVRDQARSEGSEKCFRRPPIRFPSLNLLVKCGRYITIAEGQCLWAVRRLLGNHVPVPEVYGWCRDGEEVFIYMELVQGETLEQRWDGLSGEERMSVCDKLRVMISNLRRLEQDPRGPFIGSIAQQPLLDTMFESQAHTGPFSTVKEFHDWFTGIVNRHHPNPEEFVDPLRGDLPDDAPITFTHGDLHRSNIIVSPSTEGPPVVRAIVDWHQSGWYPAYWEYCKAMWTADPWKEWATDYVPRFLEEPGCYGVWAFYVNDTFI